MKNLKEMKALYQKLGEEIEKLEERPSTVRPRAENGQRIYYRHEFGGYASTLDSHNKDDNYLYESGNYSLDENEMQDRAEKYKKVRLALQRIKDYVAENFEAFEPDWENEDQNKSWPEYDYEDTRWVWCQTHARKPLGVPFFLTNTEHVDQLIRDCEEDLNTVRDLIAYI